MGQGAYAKVYKGVNKNTGEIFALKITDFKEDRNNGIPSHLLREISALNELGQLDHPNLVKLITQVPFIDKIFMFFEFCQGDLSQLIHSWKSSPEPPTQHVYKTYLKQILSGVHACHCSRIMHRDLKP